MARSKTIKKTKPTEIKSEPNLNEEEILGDLLAQDERAAEPEEERPASEPLFSALLRSAVSQTAPDEAVLRDYVNFVVPELSAWLAAESAKGGEFAAQKLAEGKRAEEVERYKADQSLRAHLVNGLFPTAQIARTLKTWDAPRLHFFDEKAYRLLCAGYTLHDWLKLPQVDAWLEQSGLAHDKVNAATHLPLVENIFREWCARLRLDQFLAPIGGVDVVLHDLIYMACNTQVRWGTMLNLSELPRQTLNGRTRQLLADLSRLADLIAYIARNPRDLVANPKMRSILVDLSDNQAHFAYHHIAENRGVLTNFIHIAALAAMEHKTRVALLYAPSGVVYLERADAPPAPDVAQVTRATIQRMQAACKRQIANPAALIGFSRDGKGFKRAAYYDLHFTPTEEIRLTALAAYKLITEAKKSSANTRYTAMREKGLAPESADLDLPDDIRVDQLAEFCQRVEKVIAEREIELDVTSLLLEALGLSKLRKTFDAIPRDNRAGGVAYHWYLAAGTYVKKHPGADPGEWRELIEGLANQILKQLPETKMSDAGWDDVRIYIERVLSYGGGKPTATQTASDDLRAMAEKELERYSAAKKKGHGATAVCSLCSSSYNVDEQREAGILFAPQVYTNKQPLHSSKAIRNICQICSVEMMLRQILMNRTAATGGRFEGQRMRYLFFYPTYFFTPETLKAFESAYLQLKRISVTSLRKSLITEDAEHRSTLHLDAQTYQRLQPLLLDVTLLENRASDRLFRLQFPENEPVTFYFMGVPPASRDAKDAEAWINPAFLALILPLTLDVKVIASESPLPLMLEADELDETVFLDAPHDFVKYLVGRERISLDGLMKRLRVLTVAYFIHLDGNAGMGRGGYDYRWQDIPALARALSDSSLSAFAYLKKWQRKNNRDSIFADKAKIYQEFVRILDELKGGDSMSHARELTRLYRGFYRADGFKSNAILKPIQVAAETILRADPRLFDRAGLQEALEGRLNALVENVLTDRAEGRMPAGSARESRAEAVQQFARYFLEQVYFGALKGDTAALRGKQLNLLKNACESIYLTLDAEERAARKS
ncbi:MAG: type I-D CRISPR-associated protein Cas10d/Csc3 [Chloroflexi bacterium]|nr:type I-D CRISPR-associated protein Cas10d/Csc3 [Chloroflexota bacterium]